jgi:hypothetical protein
VVALGLVAIKTANSLPNWAIEAGIEEAGSHQRLLAALVDSRDLPIEPDPCLKSSEWESGEDLLERQLVAI